MIFKVLNGSETSNRFEGPGPQRAVATWDYYVQDLSRVECIHRNTNVLCWHWAGIMHMFKSRKVMRLGNMSSIAVASYSASAE